MGALGGLLPGWGALLEKLCDAAEGISLAQRSEIRSLLDRGHHINAASALEHICTAGVFNDRVQRELDVRRCIYPSTASLVALSWLSGKLCGILTTNLDRLIDITVSREAYPSLSPEALQRRLGDAVIHMHGVADKPSTWILTREQYNRAYFSNDYKDSVHSLFTSHTLMFVGYGMQDYELDLILDRIEGSYPSRQQPRHFFFMEANEAEQRPYFIHRLRHLGMRPILFRGFENLPLLLAQLALERH